MIAKLRFRFFAVRKLIYWRIIQLINNAWLFAGCYKNQLDNAWWARRLMGGIRMTPKLWVKVHLMCWSKSVAYVRDVIKSD